MLRIKKEYSLLVDNSKSQIETYSVSHMMMRVQVKVGLDLTGEIVGVSEEQG